MSKLLNEILSRENMLIAYRKVISNKGASGVDGVTVEEIKDYALIKTGGISKPN